MDASMLDSTLQERLESIKASLARRRTERDELRRCLEADSARRPINLRLLRAYFDVTQQHVGELFNVAQGRVSQLERGEEPISDSQAKDVESSLGLPAEWFDRDNGPSLFLSNEEKLLLSALKGLSVPAMNELISVVKSLKSLDKSHD